MSGGVRQGLLRMGSDPSFNRVLLKGSNCCLGWAQLTRVCTLLNRLGKHPGHSKLLLRVLLLCCWLA